MTVQLFVPCFVDQLYPDVAFNTIKVLEKAGCTVKYNAQQTCCGQPAFNAGFWGEAKDVCTKFVQDFDGADYIVSPSASCAGFVRNNYNKLFENNAFQSPAKKVANRIYELSEFLVKILNVTNLGAKFEGKATYHDSCAGLRECHIKSEPRTLLSAVEGLELIEMKDTDICCGFGGSFAVKFDTISVSMADQKIESALTTDADYLISTDMSCLMHLDGRMKHNGQSLKVVHLAEVLASGY
ncbi:MAG: (Fe-S)-binding protein [Chitinophagaceae bacterium]|jgi:L-lactate dehydrogenase complex protein LldE